jgi:hypothetical protein
MRVGQQSRDTRLAEEADHAAGLWAADRQRTQLGVVILEFEVKGFGTDRENTGGPILANFLAAR